MFEVFSTVPVADLLIVSLTWTRPLSLSLSVQNWDSQSAAQIATEICGFITILSGTFLLHKTKDMGKSPATEPPVFQSQDQPHETHSLGSSRRL